MIIQRNHTTYNCYQPSSLFLIRVFPQEDEEEEARDTFDPEPPVAVAVGASKAAAAADEMREFESATSEWMRATTEKLREENGDRFAEVGGVKS